jgi:hypothetical protein
MGNIFRKPSLFVPVVNNLSESEIKDLETTPEYYYGHFSSLEKAVHKVNQLRITPGHRTYYILKKGKPHLM